MSPKASQPIREVAVDAEPQRMLQKEDEIISGMRDMDSEINYPE